LDVAVVGLSGGTECPERSGETGEGGEIAGINEVDVDDGLYM